MGHLNIMVQIQRLHSYSELLRIRLLSAVYLVNQFLHHESIAQIERYVKTGYFGRSHSKLYKYYYTSRSQI